MPEDLIGSLNDPDPKVRRQAIWALGEQGAVEAVEPLVNFMNTTGDYKEKSLAIAALSEIGIRSLKPMSVALRDALEAPPEGIPDDVRKNNIRTVAHFYDAVMSIMQVLEAVIADDSEHPEVHQTAVWGLENLKRLRK